MTKHFNFIFVVAFFGFGRVGYGADFVEKIPVYGIVKPLRISTSIGANHGMVEAINFQVGAAVRFGQPLINVIEKEMTRSYRSTLDGVVAKVHVTQGAIVSPGMPLITVVVPNKKWVEFHMSPSDARNVQVGAEVQTRSGELFGKVIQKSPIVDPDTGAVLFYIGQESKTDHLIGEVLNLRVSGRQLKDCHVVTIEQADQFTSEFEIVALAGDQMCLKKTESPARDQVQ